MRPGIFSLISFIGLFFLLANQLLEFADDPGLGWHLASGQWMLAHHSIPRIDPFLYSPSARSWVSDQWLGDLILYSLYSLGGWPTLYIGLSVAFAVTYLLLHYHFTRRLSGNALASAFAVFLAFKLGQIHFIARPVLLSFACFVLLTGWCFQIYREGLVRKTSLCLIILFIVWANLHPSFVIGLCVVNLLGVALWFDQFLVPNRRSPVSAWVVLFLGVVCVLVTLINPYGIHLHESILQLASSSYFMQLHMEWLSPNFKEMAGSTFLLFLVVILLGLYFRGRPKSWGCFELLAGAFLVWLSLRSQRVMPYAAIFLSVPWVDAGLQLVRIEWFNKFSHIKNALFRISEREAQASNLVWVFITIFVGALVGIIGGGFHLGGIEYGPSRAKFPYAALEWVMEQGEDAVIACDPSNGGFFTFFGQGKIRPIIDDRNTLLGEEFYKSYFERLRPGQPWREFLTGLGAQLLLLPLNSNMAECLKQQELEPVFSSDKYVLFRVDDEHSAN